MKPGFVPIILAIAFLTGCASSSDLEALQTQVDRIDIQVTHLNRDIADTRAIASQALAQATGAHLASEQALILVKQLNDNVNEKLDRMFKTTSRK